MDLQAEQQQLENEIKYIRDWMDHPISKELIEDNKNEEESLVNLICEKPIQGIETFFAHFEAVGHLRGLRRFSRAVSLKIEELTSQLENL